MNKDQLKKMVGQHVRIRPVAERPGADTNDPQDDDWKIVRVDDDEIELLNLRTHHVALLGLDHIHSYMSDPARKQAGFKYGFLQLRVLISMFASNDLTIEPLPPGDWGRYEKTPTSTNTNAASLAPPRDPIECGFRDVKPTNHYPMLTVMVRNVSDEPVVIVRSFLDITLVKDPTASERLTHFHSPITFKPGESAERQYNPPELRIVKNGKVLDISRTENQPFDLRFTVQYKDPNGFIRDCSSFLKVSN